jgi:hypothetical protein
MAVSRQETHSGYALIWPFRVNRWSDGDYKRDFDSKRKYSQSWPEYNRAQCFEKSRFIESKRGRPFGLWWCFNPGAKLMQKLSTLAQR